MRPGADQLMALCEATWPPARSFASGAFLLRDGAGGGKRVSAATLLPGASWSEDDRLRAEQEMRALGQQPLFQIRAGEERLDATLEAAGYRIVDPVNLYVAPVQDLTDRPIPRVTTFCIWEPLAIMRELWAAAGIGPERLAVMWRATCDKTTILGRIEDSPAATAYVGLVDGLAMLHALEVVPAKRRKGLAQWMMRQAAVWAADRGATHLSVLCTEANTGANALYAGMGFACVGHYHYRIAEA
ncbi:GNAT family N-acetyltransferase [Marinovum algicola]|uniref:GNAT family N-acetyltransferase n=1 Tax=Marinovum algicola TaxID=42444 RepID=UPI0024BA68BF|nr:GNAT family N-acetyltransferase [Marinovum algicola]